VIAAERLDPGVDPQVLLQLVGHVEFFVAQVAGEFLGDQACFLSPFHATFH